MSRKQTFVGALVVALVLFYWRSGGPNELHVRGESRGQGDYQQDSILAQSQVDVKLAVDNAIRMPAVEAKDKGCTRFEYWWELDCTPRNVNAFFDNNKGLGISDLPCVPTRWLALRVLEQCDPAQVNEGSLSGAVASELRRRQVSGPQFADWLEPYVDTIGRLQCLLGQLSFAEGAESRRASWTARLLVAILGTNGSLRDLDPSTVESLRVLVARWPLGDEEWWGELWPGLNQGIDQEGLLAKAYVLEALFGLLPTAEWLGRIASLSDLEFEDAFGGKSLFGMGLIVSRHVSNSLYQDLFFLSDAASWQRALLFHYPRNLEWPAFAPVTGKAARRFLELRDDKDYPFVGELLLKQWKILGPTEGIADLEKFVFGADRRAEGWSFQAEMRVVAVVEAARVGKDLLDADQLEHLAFLVQELFFGGSFVKGDLILEGIRSRGLPSSNAETLARWREQLVLMLGPGRLVEMNIANQAWLKL